MRSTFWSWSENQAALLRRLASGERVNNQIDWENVVEEIESVGRSERTALASRFRLIFEHLAKLQVSPAIAPRAGWRESIRQARAAVAELLEASPSLRRTLQEVVAREMPRAPAHWLPERSSIRLKRHAFRWTACTTRSQTLSAPSSNRSHPVTARAEGMKCSPPP